MKLLDKIPFIATCPSCQVRHELSDALRLQRQLAEISSRFVTRPPEQVDDTIEETQRLICETLGVDRSTLWHATGERMQAIVQSAAVEVETKHFDDCCAKLPLRCYRKWTFRLDDIFRRLPGAHLGNQAR